MRKSETRTFTTDDGATVIETDGWAMTWTPGDWNGLVLTNLTTQDTHPVEMEENGPPPDLLIRFDPDVVLCGRNLAVATFAYRPSDLREQPRYTYLRVLFDPEAPSTSSQLWDDAATDLAYAYPAADLSRVYALTCTDNGIIYDRAN